MPLETVTESASQEIPPSIPDHSSIQTEPFRFLDLPYELRCAIYEYFVVVGKVFYSPDMHRHDADKRFRDFASYEPQELQLLRVCKQLHDEVEKLYLSKNMFVLPPYFEPCGPFIAQTIAFDCLAGARGLNHWFWENQEIYTPNTTFDKMTARQRLDFAYQESSRCLRGRWRRLRECLVGFLEVEQASVQLEIDLTDAYCPIGCCRVVDQASYLIFEMDPCAINLLGVRNGAEREVSMQSLVDSYRSLGFDDEPQSSELTKEQIRKRHNIKFE
ncbi:hypothetical protein EK21DRAFT_109265 [Setomelanomma holmii]|uniref:Uncharacterized protein n=1 Tax=Setomelanomma holmii TaxID=210430 RepID=A0A9P4HHG6_9PLEO|nr:hypothetical protein EK21DRAFT_109265 [Setomelanomma holmii]